METNSPPESPRTPTSEDEKTTGPASSWRAEPLSEAESAKVMQILQACRDNDLHALIALATSARGLVEDEIRRTAWPILLGATDTSSKDEVPWQSLPVHRDEDQVKLDVNRSFVYYPHGESEKQLDHRKQELLDLITEVLRRHSSLCYFQGYHDIVQVLLLVLGADHAAPAVARLSLLRIRDFMLPSLSAAISHLHLLPAILHAADPVLCKHVSHTQPFFALAATLTLYAHDIQEYGDIARLFDFLLAREAVISIYLFAVIILARRVELLDVPPDEPEMLHFLLSKLPNPLDLEHLISQTTTLYARYPPEALPSRTWRRISPYSVLKTTRDPANLATQTLEDGERLFAKQAAQLRRTQAIQGAITEVRKRLWMYRRPARLLVVAIAVGAVALWLGRRHDGTSSHILESGSLLSRLQRGVMALRGFRPI